MRRKLDARHYFLRKYGTPAHWKPVVLGSVARVIGGGTPSREEGRSWHGGTIPWATPTDITANDSKYITRTSECITPFGLSSSAATLLPKGTILYASRATIGARAIAAVEIATNQGFASFVPHEINGEYLYYLLGLLTPTIKRLGAGTTFDEISKRDIRSVHCAIPESESEQAAIAGILAAVDEAIAECRKTLDATKRFRESLVNSALTVGVDHASHLRVDIAESDREFRATKIGRFPREWRPTKLGKECTRIADGTHQAVATSREGVPFLYVSCVRNGVIYWDRAAHVSKRDYRLISKGREPRRGAVLYTAVGSYGFAAAVLDDREFSFQRHIAILYPKPDELDPIFLAAWLNSPIGRRWSDILAVGNAQKTVTLTALNKFPIVVPPFEEQLRIRSLLEPVHAVVTAREEKLKSLEAVKTSLMHDLLSGAVRIDPNLFKEKEKV